MGAAGRTPLTVPGALHPPAVSVVTAVCTAPARLVPLQGSPRVLSPGLGWTGRRKTPAHAATGAGTCLGSSPRYRVAGAACAAGVVGAVGAVDVGVVVGVVGAVVAEAVAAWEAADALGCPQGG